MHAVQQPLHTNALGDVMGAPAWRSLPSWYLVAENDEAIPPDAERQFAQRMGATTVEVASSHVAMVSHPGDVVEPHRDRRRGGAGDERRRASRAWQDPGDGHLLGQRARRRARAPSSSRRASTSSTANGARSSRGAEQENAFLESHSWDEYAAWHLGLTDGATDETKARYAFVYGDFRRIHRMGLIACHYRAAEWRHKEIELAAHDLLQLLDAKSA